MPKYSYEALDKGGKKVKGEIEANSEEVIIERLRGMGFYPTDVKRKKVSAAKLDIATLPLLRNIMQRVNSKRLTTFTRQFATLVGAGLPLLRSLRILEDQSDSVIFRKKIREVSQDVEGGSTLSDALGKHPKVFDKLYVNMVRAGEIGGVLENVLLKIADFLEKRQALKAKVKSAMTYPLVVLSLAVIIVGFILLKIIPKFRVIFAQLGAKELPLPTEILITVSELLVKRTPLVILGIIVLVVLIRKINHTKGGKLMFDIMKLKLPIFGEIIRKIAITRWASTLSTLITSGVPILQALDIVKDTSGNEVIARAMIRVHSSIKDGDTIHEPLAQCDIFPPLVVHMVAVGEETGAIDQMLTKVAEAYEREVDATVDALSSIIEPVMIVCLGVLVGAVVISLYLPLFMIPKLIK